MPAITYGTPPGGGYRVDVPGSGAGAGAGGFPGMGRGPDLSWLGEFARRKAQNQLAMQNLELREATRATRVRPTGRAPVDPGERALRDETIQTEIHKQQAMRRPAPQRYIFGMGYSGGPNGTQTDIQRLSGLQRQLFLPGGAGMENTGPSAMDESRRRSDEHHDFMRYMPAQTAATRRAVGR